MHTKVAPVLYSRPNKDGKYPLVIRITKDRKSSYLFLGQAIDGHFWDKETRSVKKGHPNSARLNALLIKKQAEVNKVHLSNTIDDKETTARTVYESVRLNKQKDSFFTCADSYLLNLEKEGKYNRLSAERPRINRFRAFVKNRDIAFKEITVSLLNDFKASLKGKYEVSERTAINYLIVIRSIYNLAIKSNIVEQRYYPFGKNKVRIRFPESVKIGLTKEEISRIVKLNLSDCPRIDNARNIWLISFYFAGARISDVLRLKWSDIKDGRLYYKMGKNEKADSLKIPERALSILKMYNSSDQSSHSFIFAELQNVVDPSNKLEQYKKIKNAVKNINKYLEQLAVLAKIDKKLTSHIARHSFATIAVNQNVPIQVLQKLYRHSSIITTIEYQKNFDTKLTDQALYSVLDF